ncbi:MAG: hypothetical protein LAN71_16480 [Acidobacteriia bacterium]|nr:hypothetical protein [Terriglobia bacterium]
MPHLNMAVVGSLLAALAQFGLFLRWLHRRMRDDEIARTFVRDVAVNHLPHIYSALREIAGHQGVRLSEPPLVQFIEVNGKGRWRSRPAPKCGRNRKHGQSSGRSAGPGAPGRGRSRA